MAEKNDEVFLMEVAQKKLPNAVHGGAPSRDLLPA